MGACVRDRAGVGTGHGAARGKRRHRLRPRVEDMQGDIRREQALGHGRAHLAKAEEADRGP